MATQLRHTGPTSGERDLFLDVLRAIAILRVILWHTYGSPWISYFVASLPVMFFVAGSLMARSLEHGQALDVIFRRFERLLPPLWLIAAFALGVMAYYDSQSGSFIADLSLRDVVWWIFPIWDPRGSDWGIVWWAPLWYLRCLTWLLLASPLLVWLWRRVGSALLLVPIVILAATEWRWQAGEPLPWQLQDVALYSVFWILGFAYNDRLLTALSRRTTAGVCLIAAATATIWALTQDVPRDIVNASYPLHLFVAVVWLFGALTLRGQIINLSMKQRIGAVMYWVNERALTIYLWHTAGLFVMYQILWASSNPQWMRDLLGLPIVASVTFLTVLVFGWVEDLAARRPLRLWPSRVPTTRPARRHMPILPVAAGSLVGLFAVLLSINGIREQPGSVVQPTQQTVPASGIGLQIRTQQAEVSNRPPPAPVSPETHLPVTADELQAELDVWLDVWQISGATLTLQRDSGEVWTGASGYREDGEPFEPGQQYWIGSVTKTFTVALILRLVERGEIDLDDPVSRYVPDFADAEYFTIRQLIQHTSGLVVGDSEPYLAIAEAAQSGLQSEPGSRFEYSRAGYYFLGLIIEDRTGKSYTRAIHDELLEPLELLSTLMDEEIQPLAYSTHPFSALRNGYSAVIGSSAGLYRELSQASDYHGVHWSSGGLYSTTNDLARWAIALWGSGSVVSPVSADAMTTFLGEDFGFTGLGTYAFCPCWLDGERLRAERWGHLGATGVLEYDPADRVALAIHINGLVTDENVITALDDLSARMRSLIRGRPLASDLLTSATPIGRTSQRRGCQQIEGNSYLDYLERLWYLENCVTDVDPVLVHCGLAGLTAEPKDEEGVEPKDIPRSPPPSECPETQPEPDSFGSPDEPSED